MFELTAAQLKAAKDAMGNVPPHDFARLILYLIGVFASIWFFFMLIGVWHELQQHKIDFGDALGKMAAAVFILICTGALLTY